MSHFRWPEESRPYGYTVKRARDTFLLFLYPEERPLLLLGKTSVVLYFTGHYLWSQIICDNQLFREDKYIYTNGQNLNYTELY